MIWILYVTAIGYADQGDYRMTARFETSSECILRASIMHDKLEPEYPFVVTKCKGVEQ